MLSVCTLRRDYVDVPLAWHDASLAALNLHLFRTLAVDYVRVSSIEHVLTLMVERVILRDVVHAPAHVLLLVVVSELALVGHRHRMVGDGALHQELAVLYAWSSCHLSVNDL